jgi:hypothetical protein
MIWHTIEQAAEVMGLTPATIRRWIASGDLPVKAHPVVPGAQFVDDGDLLAAELAVHHRKVEGAAKARMARQRTAHEAEMCDA